ncbi:MAG: hypothetical protein HY437_01605 [Candidatus Magasanikbacteria bacterium]|nr:hypothetical protein [Candidatus Magasanikbacteria bacterium]
MYHEGEKSHGSSGVSSPETARSRESERRETEPKKVLREFAAFVQKHQDLIARELKQGRKLPDIIYDNFYSEDIDNQKYREGDPRFEKMRATYQREAAQVLEKFLGLSRHYEGQKDPPIAPAKKSIENGWVYFKTFGGTHSDTQRGRFYFNIRPERLTQFYEAAVTAFANDGLPIEAKISRTANPGDMNRYDKMVVYCDEEYQRLVYEVIGKLHRENNDIFEVGGPKFTVPVEDERGKIMTGVAFGEEPGAEQGGHSFGDIRSKILTDVYRAAAHGRFALTDKRAVAAFEDACETYGVDPKKPAFNASRLTA